MKKSASKNVISLLKQDHKHVKDLLTQLEETTTRGIKRRAKLLEEIATEVRLHAYVEETIFYPAFRQAVENKEDEKLFLEAGLEHGLVHEMLPTLETTDPASELFSARAKVLKDLIVHHAEEEERSMFPRVKQLMEDERLKELGAEIEARKQTVQEEGLKLEPAGVAAGDYDI